MRGWLALIALAGCGGSPRRAAVPVEPAAPMVTAAAATPADAKVAVDLPAIPTFSTLTYAAGVSGVDGLRHMGPRRFGDDVAVEGYVVWIYRCPTLEDDPTSCTRPHFYLGAAASTPKEGAIRVVEVPRPPTKIEKKRLPRAELAEWPEVPAYAVGDRVIVRGQWNDRAPHGDMDSSGLLVYGALEHVAADAPPPTTTADTATRANAEALTAAIQANPTDDAAYRRLGALYRDWRFLDEAIKVYEAGITHVPDGAQRRALVYAKALVYDERGELDRALAAIDTVLADEPDDARARLQRGLWRHRKGDFAGAKLDLEAAVKDAPDDLAKRAAQRALMDLAAEGH